MSLKNKKPTLRLISPMLWAMLFLIIVFLVWYSWPRKGTVDSFMELENILEIDLPEKCELFPSEGSLSWEIKSPLLHNINVTGKINNFESYIKWFSKSDISEEDFKVVFESNKTRFDSTHEQEFPPPIATSNDRFIDELFVYKDDRVQVRLYVLQDNRFYMIISYW